MSDSQFQSRRKLIIDEANSISTSSLRAQAIGGRHGTQIADLLKNYTRLRIDFFAAGEDRERLKTIYQQTSAIQGRIWDHASVIDLDRPRSGYVTPEQSPLYWLVEEKNVEAPVHKIGKAGKQ